MLTMVIKFLLKFFGENLFFLVTNSILTKIPILDYNNDCWSKLRFISLPPNR